MSHIPTPKYCIVQFSSSCKQYTYMTDLDLAPDDLVVVESPSDGFVVVKVVETRGLTPGQMSRATKWVVQKIDVTDYLKKVERAKIAQEVRNRLNARKDQLQELFIYKQLAESDPQMAKLLEQLYSVDDTLMLDVTPVTNDDPKTQEP